MLPIGRVWCPPLMYFVALLCPLLRTIFERATLIQFPAEKVPPSIMYTDTSLPGEGIVLDRLYQRVQCVMDSLCQTPCDLVTLSPSIQPLSYDLLYSYVSRFRASVDLVTQISPV